MSVLFTDHIFHEEEQGLHIVQQLGESTSLSCHIMFVTQEFVDYQKELFQDFVSVLIDMLSDETVAEYEYKQHFEVALQDLNTKLQVFAEKIE